MASNHSLYSLDPEHISCIGGRTVVTCKSCAGNAPRGSICPSCNGRGFNIFVCAHCNPAAAAAAARAMAVPTSASATSSAGSLSRNSSSSYPSHPDPRGRSYGQYGDRDGASCGRIDTDANRSRNP